MSESTAVSQRTGVSRLCGAVSEKIDFPDFAVRLILVSTAAVGCGLASAQSDTWWQLRAGKDIWRTHRVSLVDTWSYTAAGDYWPNHEWLWQALAYVLHSVGGMPLLGLVTGVLAAGSIVLVAPRGATRLDVVFLLFATPLVMSVVSIRPQVASLFVFGLLLTFLRRERWWAIPPLMLVWANLHGAVATGGVTLVAACGAAVVVDLRERTPETRARALKLAAVTALSGLATLVTPLGFELWRYVVDSIARSKHNGIQEWHSAFQLTFFALWFWGCLAGTILVAVLARRRIRGWDHTLLMVVVLAQTPFAISAIRNFSFFILAALPLCCAIARRPSAPRTDDVVPHGRVIVVGAAVVGAVAVLATYVIQPARLGWNPMSPAAAAAIEACPGHVYTTYYGGGFLIWFTPDVKVFVDNRQDPYPPDIINLGNLGPNSLYLDEFVRYDVRCAAIDPDHRSTVQRLTADGWSTTYDDGTWRILQRP